MADDQHTRPPLDPDLASRVDARWRVEVVAESGSTNADAAERWRDGEDSGLVLVAEHQTAGRGRGDRSWVTTERSSLIVSFLLAPEDVAPQRWPWLPLLTGLAVAEAVRETTGLSPLLKWPNDVLLPGPEGPLKVAGILLERVERAGGAAAVVGVGLNCSQAPEELPVPGATSLALAAGAPVDRSALLVALSDALARRYDAWVAGEDPVEDYARSCSTIGQEVRVSTPSSVVTGTAEGVDDGGRLLVRTAEGTQALGAGDVVHVRPAS